MGTVRCRVEEIILDGNNKLPVDSVQATCISCGNITSSYGRGSNSVRRCFALMRESCPRGESHYYEEA